MAKSRNSAASKYSYSFCRFRLWEQYEDFDLHINPFTSFQQFSPTYESEAMYDGNKKSRLLF